jgi:hypothetical protein
MHWKAFADDINVLCMRLGVLSFGFLHLSSLEYENRFESCEPSLENEEIILHPIFNSKYISFF